MTSEARGKRTLVSIVGSYNVGLFLKSRRLPHPGETVIGDQFHEGGGGKGSNQAVAAHRLGAEVRFVGRIGADKYGTDALRMYRQEGMAADGIFVDPTTHTGISVILIGSDGTNMISVIPGANFNFSKKDIDDAVPLFQQSAIVGFQLENRLDVIAHGIRRASESGASVLLDPAPAEPLPEDLLPLVTYMKPNEHEAAVITGIEVTTVASAERAGQWFLERGVKNAIITLGEDGCLLVNQDGSRHFPTHVVDAVDTTGAGDAFSGALIAGLSGGSALEEAVEFANAAAAVSVTKLGVVEAIPTKTEVEAFLSERTDRGNPSAALSASRANDTRSKPGG